jgi:NAD(P)-dependent dehydrogenase (short-subunit alcohol dehydrogenase family)
MMSVSVDLGGQVAVVTGAGSGIGEATARLLARANASVVVVDMAEDAAKRVATEIVDGGGSAVAACIDISDIDVVESQLAVVRSELGPVRILVNNAAAAVTKLFVDTTPEEIDRVFAVNLRGTMNMTRTALSDLTSTPGGRVVNVVSDSGRTGERFLSVYATSKAGLIGFTKSLAREVGRFGTTVNGVSPGTTETPSSSAFIDAAGGAEKLAKAYPLGRIGRPEDIAGAVLFFASSFSEWITGQILSVSGGYTMV